MFVQPPGQPRWTLPPPTEPRSLVPPRNHRRVLTTTDARTARAKPSSWTHLKELSQFIGYPEKYCSEWFVAQMGRSFSQYVKNSVWSARLMLQSSSRLADIAEQLGFQDQYAFSHFFKKSTGLSPKTFREQRTSAAAVTVLEQ